MIDSPEAPPAARPDWKLLLAPFVVAVLVFARTWTHGFVYDDIDLLQRNEAMHEWATIARGFQEPFWSLADFRVNAAPYYRPVAATGFVLLNKLGGGEPWAFHVANTLVHALCALLVARLALAIGLDRRMALCAGLAFALSGAHVEAVAWASALPDLLATGFSLLALCWWVRGRLALALLAGLAAALSKEAGYATLLLMLGSALLGSRTLPLPRRLPATLGVLAVALVVWLLRWMAFDSPAAGFDKQLTFTAFDGPRKLSLSLGLIVRYLAFLVWPVGSRPFRPLDLALDDSERALFVGLAWIGALVLMVSAVVWLRRGRRSGLVLIGLGLLVGGLAPVLNTDSIGRFPFEERFVYLSSAGFALLLGALLGDWWRRGVGFGPAARRDPRLGPAAAATTALVLLAINLVPLLRVTPKWSDNETFARWTTEVSPETMTPWILAGQALLMCAEELPQGSVQRAELADEAFDYFERATQIDVDEVLVARHERELGNVAQGDALYVGEDYRTAEQVYRETLKGYPRSQMAHFGLSNVLLYRADLAYNRILQARSRAEAEAAQGEIVRLAEEALQSAEVAVAGERRLPAAARNASVAHYWLARFQDPAHWDAAERYARQAVAQDPTNFQFVGQLAGVLDWRQKPEDVVRVLEDWLRRAPDDAPERALVAQQLEAARAAVDGR